jgi:hypothetical protein
MQLEFGPVEVLAVKLRGDDHDLGIGDLPAQVLPQDLLVARRPLVGRTGVAVEEIARALQVLENAEIVLVLLPDVADEQADGVFLRYAAHGSSVCRSSPWTHRG